MELKHLLYSDDICLRFPCNTNKPMAPFLAMLNAKVSKNLYGIIEKSGEVKYFIVVSYHGYWVEP